MGFLSDLLGGITGSTQAKAATQAAQVQQQAATQAAGGIQAAGGRAQELFAPFQQVGQRGVDLSSFLGDPQAQFESLQNNPLFQLAVEQGARGIGQTAAAQGRVSSGDTLTRLSQNTLTAAQPLIDRQRADILGLLGIGQQTAGSQANIETNTAAQIADLLTGGAAAQAGGIIGAGNARAGLAGNIIDIGTLFGTGGAFGGPPPGGRR